MFKWLMHRAMARFERKWNYDASYVHEMIYVVRNPDKLRHLLPS